MFISHEHSYHGSVKGQLFIQSSRVTVLSWTSWRWIWSRSWELWTIYEQFWEANLLSKMFFGQWNETREPRRNPSEYENNNVKLGTGSNTSSGSNQGLCSCEEATLPGESPWCPLSNYHIITKKSPCGDWTLYVLIQHFVLLSCLIFHHDLFVSLGYS